VQVLQHINAGDSRTLRYALRWENAPFDVDAEGVVLTFVMSVPGSTESALEITNLEVSDGLCEVDLGVDDTADLAAGFYKASIFGEVDGDRYRVAHGDVAVDVPVGVTSEPLLPI
jgi:hypothetical protein